MYIDIQDGTNTARNSKYRIALNAASADVAQKLATENVGSVTRPVYFDGGVPVECVDFLPLTAGADKKLTGPLGLTKDIGYGATLPEDGFEGQVFFLDDQTPDLPLGGTTGQVLVKNSNTDKDAGWTSQFTGNAASANMLNTDAGSSAKPVYFDGGIPIECDDTLDVSITGSASKWTNARNFNIASSDGSNAGATTSVDGSKAITIKLPTTIKASLDGNAKTATSAGEATKLTTNAGNVNNPVYFDGGIPVACDIIKNDIESNNIKANTLNADIITSNGESNTVTDINGEFVSVANFDAQVLSMLHSAGIVGVVDLSNSTAAGITKDTIGFGTVDTSTGEITNLTTVLTPTGLRGNADTATLATEASKLAIDKVGNATLPVYFDGGLPVACNNDLDVNVTGTASAWTTARNFTISDGTNTGTPSSVDGSNNVTIKLPTTIKANLTGTASEATHAVSADRLGDLNAGFAHTPIYFDNGIPTSCTSPLMLDTNGNAATATKWKDDKNFVITDADGTHSGETVIVNGTGDITLALPEEIKADLIGTANLAKALTGSAGSATKPVYFDSGIPTNCDDTLDVSITGNANTASTASKLDVDAGSAVRPVYFVDGIPKPCTSLDLSTTGNAATATVASKLSVASAGDTNTPVYFVDGIPQACTSLDLSTTGNAGSANKLNTNAGDANTPVYFENGIPKACSSLDLNASSADKLNTNAGDINTPVYFENGIPVACGGGGFLPLSAGPDKKLTGALGLTENVMYGTTLPETGFDGQLFFLAEDAEGTPLYVPENGQTGEALIKNSATSGDYSWKKISAFPEILTATYDTTDTSVSRYTAVGDEALKDGLTIAIKLDATSTAATSNFVLNYNNSGDKQIYDNRGVAMTYYRARAKYILILVYNSTDDCWYAVTNPDPLWPISYTHTTADQKCYLVGYNVATATGSYGINTLQRNQNVYMNPSTGSIYANKVYGAVWNDYAEFRAQQEVIEPGYCVASTDNGKVYKTTDKFQACDGIVSDTFGFSIGETDECKTPLAVAGRVLAYCEGNRYDYHSGDTVCAGPNGKVCKMTREEIREWPDRIVGIVSEIPEYKIWGDGNVPVNGRIWIRIK